MDAVFPITQRNGEEFHTLSDFKQLFKEVKSGRYILSQGHGWHSGVHLTSKILPYGKGLRPIQAMLSGKIVAYRINPDYQISVYQEQELSFSNNFVLIEHTAKNPDQKKEDDFYFYSLYMHLAPPSDIGANSSVTTRYKLLTGRNVRTFKLDSEPERNKHESTISLPADSVFEYLYAEEKTTKPYAINSKTYNTIKCRVISVGNNANPTQKSLQGKTVWFASGLNSPFDILDNPKVVSKEPMNEPKWMSHSLAQIRDGSVQVISTTNINNTPIPPEAIISIEAGDDIGYMGLHEYSQDTHATKQEDNRVHIEVFSVKQPPEFFLKSLGPKNAESNGFTLIDGSSSSGALDDSNLLFKEIAGQITQATQDGTKIDFSSYTPKELKVYLNTKQEKFEKLIVKHASEWHDKSNSHMFNSIVEAGRKILEDKLITRFISRDEYDSSDYKKLVLEAHDKLVDHEKERIDKFAWMQDASELNIPKEIWHFWPFCFKRKQNLINVNDFINMYKQKFPALRKPFIFSSKSEQNLRELLITFNNYYKSCPQNYNKYKLSYMLATAQHESYHFLSGEYFSLKPEIGTKSYFNKYDPVLADNEEHKNRAKRNGNINEGDGYKYRGRGYVHLTWENNYQRAKNKFKIDFIKNPDLAMTLENAVNIMIWGMDEGIFTGKKLTDYITGDKKDYKEARKVINGLDAAELISKYAAEFENILEKTT